MLALLFLSAAQLSVNAVPGQLGAAAIRELQRQAASAMRETVVSALEGPEEPPAAASQKEVASDPGSTFTFGPDCAWNFHGTADVSEPSPTHPPTRMPALVALAAVRQAGRHACSSHPSSSSSRPCRAWLKQLADRAAAAPCASWSACRTWAPSLRSPTSCKLLYDALPVMCVPAAPSLPC